MSVFQKLMMTDIKKEETTTTFPLEVPKISYDNNAIDYSLYGGSVQRNIPAMYQQYTSVEDTDGNVYTLSNGVYPAKRLADNVFGLYNSSTGVFQTEI